MAHDSLRSFLLQKKHHYFAIDESEANGHVTSVCLHFLSEPSPESKGLETYAANLWVSHLSGTTSKQSCLELLIHIYQFFRFKGPRTWIRAGLSKAHHYGSSDLDVHVEKNYLLRIKDWLGSREWSRENTEADWNANELLNEAYQWSQDILEGEQRLGQIIGKAAANVWLYDTITNFGELQTTFLLALKYYWQRENKTSSNTQELERFSATKFRNIADWAGITRNSHVQERNLGVAYFTLRQWEDCIRCFKMAAHSNQRDFPFWIQFGDAYLSNCKPKLAIDIFQTALGKFPNEQFWMGLGKAFSAKGDNIDAINAFRAATEKFPQQESFWQSLGDVYKAIDDLEGVVNTFQAAVEKNPIEPWSWIGLRDAKRRVTIQELSKRFKMPLKKMLLNLGRGSDSEMHTKLKGITSRL